MDKVDSSELEAFYFQELNKLNRDDLIALSKNLLGYELETERKKRKSEMVTEILEWARRKNKLETIEKFFEVLSKLDGISIERAKKYLAEVWRVPPERLEEIKRKGTLAMLLYELNILDDIDGLVFAASIDKSRMKYEYSLTVSSQRDLRDSKSVKASLSEFCELWNTRYPNALWAELVTHHEGTLMIKIVREYGKRVVKQFKARNEGRRPDKDKEDFRLTTLEFYPVSYLHIYLRPISGGFNIVFNFDPEKEQELVENLLSCVLGVDVKFDRLVRYIPEDIQRAENKTKELVVRCKGESNKIMREFNKVKENALKRVEKLDLPESKKNKLKEIIKRTQIIPPEIVDDPSYGVIEVIQLVDPEIFTKYPAGKRMLEAAFELAEVSSGKKAYCFLLGNKPIVIVDGVIKARKRLGELDLEAIRIIFGESGEEKEV